MIGSYTIYGDGDISLRDLRRLPRHARPARSSLQTAEIRVGLTVELPGRPRATRCRLLALGALLAGCGSSGTVQGGNDAFSATTLTVYSDLPLLGPDGAAMSEIVNGELLALYDARRSRRATCTWASSR